MIDRRSILGFMALSPAVLVSCKGMTAVQIADQAANDINIVGNGLQSALPSLVSSGLLSASTLATIQTDIASVASVAKSITTASTQVEGQSAVQQIETLVNAIVASLAGLSLPAPFGPALTAAQVLLPVIETAVGLAVSVITAPKAAAPTMTPEEARLILLGAR